MIVARAMVSLLAVVTLGAAAADAGASTSKAKRRAKALAKKAEKAFNSGELERAATLLRRAYTLDPAPTLVYNLARVLDATGDLPAARAAYREYLTKLPEARDRRLVESRIATITQLLNPPLETPPPAAEGAAATAGPLPPPPTVSPPPPAVVLEAPPAASGPGVGPWVTIAGGGVGLVAGSVLAVLASNKESAAVDEPVQTEAAELATQAEDLALGRNVAFAIGSAAVVAGVTWMLLSLN